MIDGHRAVTLPDKTEPERQSQRPVVSFETVAVGRQRRRIDGGLVIVGLAVLLVVVAVARPWAGSATPPVAAVRSGSPAPHPSIPAIVALPSKPTSIIAAAQSALARVMLDPAGYAHQWGVAIGGAIPGGGPAFDIRTRFPIISIAVDGSWATWAGVQPVIAAGPSSSTSVPSANLNPPELCTGLPRLPAGPQVLEIT